MHGRNPILYEAVLLYYRKCVTSGFVHLSNTHWPQTTVEITQGMILRGERRFLRKESCNLWSIILTRNWLPMVLFLTRGDFLCDHHTYYGWIDSLECHCRRSWNKLPREYDISRRLTPRMDMMHRGDGLRGVLSSWKNYLSGYNTEGRLTPREIIFHQGKKN